MESLQARFPYMFAGPVISMEYYQGWFPTLVQLCVELDQLLGEHKALFYWRQIKEKFGGCRLYFAFRSGRNSDQEGGDLASSDQEDQQPDESLAELRAQVAALVRRATEQMNVNCVICAEPALPESYDGYWQTLCSYHRPEIRLARGDLRWLCELAEVPQTSQQDGPA